MLNLDIIPKSNINAEIKSVKTVNKKNRNQKVHLWLSCSSKLWRAMLEHNIIDRLNLLRSILYLYMRLKLKDKFKVGNNRLGILMPGNNYFICSWTSRIDLDWVKTIILSSCLLILPGPYRLSMYTNYTTYCTNVHQLYHYHCTNQLHGQPMPTASVTEAARE